MLTMLEEEEEVSTSLSRESESQEDRSSSLQQNAPPLAKEQSSSSPEEMGGIADKDSAGVARWRRMVVIMLVLTAVLVMTCTYIFLSREEVDAFVKSYKQSAGTITDAAEFYERNVAGAVFTMADSITAEGLRAGDDAWPLFTKTDFEIIGAHARLDTQTGLIMFSPLVPGIMRGQWENYTVENQSWISECQALSRQTRTWFGEDSITSDDLNKTSDVPNIPDKIYRLEGDVVSSNYADDLHLPVWQVSPPPLDPSIVNYDLLSNPSFRRLFDYLVTEQAMMRLSEFLDFSFLYEGIAMLDRVDGSQSGDSPESLLFFPVRGNFEAVPSMIGIISAVISWKSFLSDLLTEGVDGVYVVVENTCGQVVTFLLNGPTVEFVGEGDLHSTKYNYLQQSTRFGGVQGPSESGLACAYTINVYPSAVYQESFSSAKPEVFTCILAGVFLLTGCFFFAYVRFVQRRQARVVATAQRTNAIVSSLFPSNVRDRILRDAGEQVERDMKNRSSLNGAKDQLKNFLEDEPEDAVKTDVFATKPIADLFPDVTVMFGDLVGFTAWSSVREPSQVFTLLESVYHSFDEIAKRRGVFKVETVGDCYVAVTGLPEPRHDHAVVMARFANECNIKLMHLVRELEVTLGPDTGDLTMRFGLHSGPVTAGVLRGERARFQLFGDTVNTASRIETAGEKERIHMSQETADLLIAGGKSHWLQKRDVKITAKGKGELQTFWLDTTSTVTNRNTSEDDEQMARQSSLMTLEGLGLSGPIPKDVDGVCGSPKLTKLDEKTLRLIEWNVDLLLRSLRDVVARRQSLSKIPTSSARLRLSIASGTVLDEVQESIALPIFDAQATMHEVDPRRIEIDEQVEAELHDFVSTIAMLYRENPFHNFEHASHVTMSVVKLLSRIVAPADVSGDTSNVDKDLHDHTYGITSDPIMQFACIFSALIHDVDHVGVPNSQLIEENAAIASLYSNKSVAEQNSVDLAWRLLLDERYDNLRATIYATQAEFKRFRQLVVNSVMATDIMDKDLKALRNSRWDKAFNATTDQHSQDAINRKATIVIEHLIQASDVAHTMQHWHIYRKWNERLFMEMYKAYTAGRAETDPSENWYKGEMGFFDFYIIPLAKKLKDCGVFGVSSEEYLDYAMKNRKEWELRGQEVVVSMIEKVKEENKAPVTKRRANLVKAISKRSISKYSRTWGENIQLGSSSSSLKLTN